MDGASRLTGPDGLVLDLDLRTATVQGDLVELSRREFDLMTVLLHERGRVVPFSELARRVWGHEETTADQRFIYTTAWRLRRALEAAGASDVVQGVRGVGYFVPELPEASASSQDASVLALFDPLDPDRRVSFVSEAAEELTGYDVQTLTHQPSQEIGMWGAEERARMGAAIREALESSVAEVRGCRMWRADGEPVLIDVRFRRLDHGHSPPRMLAEINRSPANGDVRRDGELPPIRVSPRSAEAAHSR